MYSQLPSPLRSPMDIRSSLTNSPSSSLGFPIFHQDYAAKGPNSVAHQKTSIRLGEAAISRDRHRPLESNLAWPTPYASSSPWMNTNSGNIQMTNLIKNDMPVLDHTVSSPSASCTSSSNMVSKVSKKKQDVDPQSYHFTSESALVTDPVKFDREVIAFLKGQGTPVVKMPSVDKKWLSFWSLFHGKTLIDLNLAVHEFGGSKYVTKARKWKQVAHKLLLPTTLTSASYTLRTFYSKYLVNFEQYYHNHPDKEKLDIYKSVPLVGYYSGYMNDNMGQLRTDEEQNLMDNYFIDDQMMYI